MGKCGTDYIVFHEIIRTKIKKKQRAYIFSGYRRPPGENIDGVQWNTTTFANADKFIVEGLAQFYTKSICEKYENRQPGVLDAFNNLLEKQPSPYTDFNSWAKDHFSEVIRFSLIFARSNGIVDYEEFKSAMSDIEHRIKIKGNDLFGTRRDY